MDNEPSPQDADWISDYDRHEAEMFQLFLVHKAHNSLSLYYRLYPEQLPKWWERPHSRMHDECERDGLTFFEDKNPSKDIDRER